jgi:hypothetical protein
LILAISRRLSIAARESAVCIAIRRLYRVYHIPRPRFPVNQLVYLTHKAVNQAKALGGRGAGPIGVDKAFRLAEILFRVIEIVVTIVKVLSVSVRLAAVDPYSGHC